MSIDVNIKILGFHTVGKAVICLYVGNFGEYRELQLSDIFQTFNELTVEESLIEQMKYHYGDVAGIWIKKLRPYLVLDDLIKTYSLNLPVIRPSFAEELFIDKVITKQERDDLIAEAYNEFVIAKLSWSIKKSKGSIQKGKEDPFFLKFVHRIDGRRIAQPAERLLHIYLPIAKVAGEYERALDKYFSDIPGETIISFHLAAERLGIIPEAPQIIEDWAINRL